MPSEAFDKDAEGNVITNPVMGWTTLPVVEMAVLLQIQYAETPERLETGCRRIQLVLTPLQCLELAQRLTRQARRVFDQPQTPQ